MATWTDRAACRSVDTELFFPIGAGRQYTTQIRAAKAVCDACPVRAACLADALGRGERFGIWGGLTETERARERRRAVRRGWDGPVKACARCEVPQPVSRFYRRDGRKDGRDSYCRTCHVELVQERQARKKAAVAS